MLALALLLRELCGAQREAIFRHFASTRRVSAATRASSVAQKDRLTAAVRTRGSRTRAMRPLATPAPAMIGSPTAGTETAAAKGEPMAERCVRARPQ